MLTTPTFNGSAIFGSAVVCATVPNPPAVQQNAYPQVNGTEIVNLGSRGRATQITGVLTAPDLPTLQTLVATFRLLQENVTVAALVTSDGSTYPYCRLVQFREDDRIMQPGGGGLLRKYTAVFEHLV